MSIENHVQCDLQAVKLSFGRCRLKGDVIENFYNIFLNSHPDIAGYFKNTDMTRQKHLLHQGINLAILYAQGMQMGERGLTRIQDSHDRNHMNIPPKLYPYWKSSFLQAVVEADPEMTPNLKADWDTVLQAAVDYVTAGY